MLEAEAVPRGDRQVKPPQCRGDYGLPARWWPAILVANTRYILEAQITEYSGLCVGVSLIRSMGQKQKTAAARNERYRLEAMGGSPGRATLAAVAPLRSSHQRDHSVFVCEDR